MRKISIVILSILVYFSVRGSVYATSFTPGEKFTYQVSYKQLKLGKSVLTFQGEEDLGGQSVYHVTFFTKTAALRDTEELYADKDTFLPIEVRRTVRKKIGFSDSIIERYDQKGYRVDISQESKLRKNEFFIEKDSPIHNAILLVYYCRTMETFDKNKPIKINLPTSEFDVMYNGVETLETRLGEFRAHVFTSEPPKFKLWLSNDERKTPLKIQNPGRLGYCLEIKSID